MLFLSDSVYRMDDLDTDEYIRRIRALNAIKDRWLFYIIETNFNFFWLCLVFVFCFWGIGSGSPYLTWTESRAITVLFRADIFHSGKYLSAVVWQFIILVFQIWVLDEQSTPHSSRPAHLELHAWREISNRGQTKLKDMFTRLIIPLGWTDRGWKGGGGMDILG